MQVFSVTFAHERKIMNIQVKAVNEDSACEIVEVRYPGAIVLMVSTEI